MKKIPLTQGLEAIVDDDQYEALSRHKWCVARRGANGSHPYAVRHVRGPKPGTYYHEAMHRVVIGAKKGEICDHINRDTLDNRRENLRIVTRGENMANCKMLSNNTSGYRGVTRAKNGRWIAQLKTKGVCKKLGMYGTPEEAYEAYKKAFNTKYNHINKL